MTHQRTYLTTFSHVPSIVCRESYDMIATAAAILFSIITLLCAVLSRGDRGSRLHTALDKGPVRAEQEVESSKHLGLHFSDVCFVSGVGSEKRHGKKTPKEKKREIKKKKENKKNGQKQK